MKKLLNVLALTLAANFLVLAGAVAWMCKSGRLDAQKLSAIRDIVFPPPAAPVPTTQPSPATTQPILKLEELLANYAGRPASEQLEYIRRTFDSRMAQLERSHRELLDLQNQVDLAQKKLDQDKKKLAADTAALAAREEQSRKLATDKGFQDTMALYESLPAKQVKTIFMSLNDDTVIQYLQAMEPRTAAKITREFKSSEEADRLTKILEKMRQAQASTAAKE